MNETEIKELREAMGCAEGQSMLERARHFTNPEKFIPVDKIILGIVRGEKGTGTIMGECNRGEIKNAWAEINYKCIQSLTYMDMQIARSAASEKRIIGG